MNSTSILRRAAQQAFRLHHANTLISWPIAQRSLHLLARQAPPQLLRTHFVAPTIHLATRARHESTTHEPRPLTDQVDNTNNTDADKDARDAAEIAARKAQEPAYEMTFTCRKCLHRSSHRVTKQAYHFGTCLITCPGCKNRHLISDHLKIFSDKGITVEDMLREKGEFLKKGRLGEDGDIEFYEEHKKEA